MDAEISTFVKGHALIHLDCSDKIDICVGDTAYFGEKNKK